MSIADKLTTVAENQQKVFDAGKDAQWNALWDAIQRGGQQIPHQVGGLFCMEHWNDDTFKPKYNIVTGGSIAYMFMHCHITDLRGILESRGLTFDCSASTNFHCAFYGSWITRMPIVNASNASALSQTFYDCQKLESIEKLSLSATTTYTHTFYRCYALTDLTIGGTIGQNGLDVQYSTKLSHDSLMSIIHALENKTSGTWTVTFGATNLAKLTDAEKAIATEKGWTLA